MNHSTSYGLRLKSRFWSDLTTQDFAQLQTSSYMESVVAVLPVAATEQHGPHLPVSVDTDLVNGVIEAALPHLPADLPVLFLPTQVIGKSNEHSRFPGTLTLSAQTVIQVWMDIGECVAKAGIRKLVLFNAHGGQVSVMDIVARDLRVKHDMVVYSSSWYSLPMPAAVGDLFSADEHRFGIHGGEMETSMMLALRPQWVDMGLAQDFKSTSQDRHRQFPILGNGKSAKLGWQMQDYNRQGAAGNAALATAEKGHTLIQASAQQLAAMLSEVSHLPMSTLQ
jgi:creatinine amidohydrolase